MAAYKRSKDDDTPHKTLIRVNNIYSGLSLRRRTYASVVNTASYLEFGSQTQQHLYMTMNLLFCSPTSRRQWWELECWTTSTAMPGPGDAKAQQNTVHGRGHCFRWFPDRCCDSEDHPGRLCSLYHYQHCAQNTYGDGLRQGPGYRCRTSKGVWPACKSDREAISVWSIGSRVREPFVRRLAFQGGIIFWLEIWEETMIGNFSVWWTSNAAFMLQIKLRALKISRNVIGSCGRPEEKPRCDEGDIEMTRIVSSYRDVFERFKLKF